MAPRRERVAIEGPGPRLYVTVLVLCLAVPVYQSHSTLTMLLAGKMAVVTGGGSGIGRAICQRLANHGAKLVVADMNKNAAIETVEILGASNQHSAFPAM
ncbi:hypothetical protein ANCDUO_16222 [Ancylostoma duodenale]|uniref:Uncharacterized protein n=1 Tax=Ancylostoma duodenale TaxID=51022 RepID=A0A0C2FYG2_9BILA|nr:hypothetical protein ANCDUO_16222 [Ancylostoma duodenale]